MNRRYSITTKTGTGNPGDPIRPNTTGNYVVVAETANRFLIKEPVASGTAFGTGDIADLLQDANGNFADLVDATALTAPQQTAIKTWITNNFGATAANLFTSDGVNDRRKLLVFLLRRVLNRLDLDGPTVISGYDVSE